jgi:molybdate transport system substrate-binding protein
MKLFLKIIGVSLFLLVFTMFFSCSSKSKQTNSITVFAAASLTNVMNEMAREFKKETGYTLRLNFASSGILARQIENGAPYDYYLSANKQWMDYLDSLKLVDRNSIRTLAANRMVAIVPIENEKLRIDSATITHFPQLFKGRISLGDPSYVPAGKYAMQIIENHAWTEELEARILPAKNVRDALFVVEIGEVEMGMVYASDAIKSNKVRVVYEFLPSDCDPIQYYGASNKNSKKGLRMFLDFLKSDSAKLVWLKNDFRMD